jgi:hypothetical protein
MASGHAAEEGDGEREAVAAGGGGRRADESGEKAVEGALGDWSGLQQQFVEQVVCVLRAERPGADARRGGGKATWGGRCVSSEVEVEEERRRWWRRACAGSPCAMGKFWCEVGCLD